MIKYRLKNLFVHCSDSAFGEVQIIDSWHKQRGWRGIGYHYIVLNGRPFKDVNYIEFLDGQIQPGHSLNDDPIFQDSEIGAHVAGRNSSSLGICLIGVAEFTDLQLLAARKTLLALADRFGLQTSAILGHYEDLHANKTCPNIPMDYFREFLQYNISLEGMQQCIKNHVEALHLV